MKNTNLKIFILSFLSVFALQLAVAFTDTSTTPPNNSTTSPSTNFYPMDKTSTNNFKEAGLSVKKFASGTTGLITIDQVGNVGVNATSPQSDVRLFINCTTTCDPNNPAAQKPSIKISTFAGTGDRKICSSTTGSSTDGYPLVICP